jgi:hypothetical protein
MSEDARKRRVRDCRARFCATLTGQGWTKCRSLNGPYDFEAERGQSRLRVRICFSFPEKGDILALGYEPSVYRCYREIWYVGPTGKVEMRLRVSGTVFDPLKGKFK